MPEQGLSLPDAPNDTGRSDPQSSDSNPHIRALQVEFNTKRFFELENGDLLIKDVPLLAEGEWTDSAQKTPLFYPARTLELFAGNWIRRTGFNRHQGDPENNWSPYGVPRNESNRVSEAINPHFGQFVNEGGETHNAILSDLLVYGSSPSGRAMQEMIKAKNIKFVSVEHGGDEQENPVTRHMEAVSLVFGGFAFVNKGACKVCKFNEAPPEADTPAQPEEKETMEIKELEAKLEAVTKELEAVKAQKPAEVKAEIPKELMESVAKMEARIKELENQPAPPVTTPVVPKELGEVETIVVIDKKEKTIRGMG